MISTKRSARVTIRRRRRCRQEFYPPLQPSSLPQSRESGPHCMRRPVEVIMSRKHPENGPSLSKASNGNTADREGTCRPAGTRKTIRRGGDGTRRRSATKSRQRQALRSRRQGERRHYSAARRQDHEFWSSFLRKPDGRNQIKSTSTDKIHTRPGPRSQ